MEELLNQLNQSQREAVVYNDGPSLVIAGAGSGKTRVLTYKIAYLVRQGIPAYNILALTFTNKAAREMKERISVLTDDNEARRLWMGTFHSIFSRILRREAGRIGYASDFTIYDASDSKNLIKSILKDLQLDDKLYKPGMIQSRISNAKNALFTPEQYACNKEIIETDQAAKVPELKNIYQIYWNRCRNAGVMDFDDLLLYTNLLFRDHPDILERYQEQFRFILVDEYQDTNYAQHLVVQQLAQQHHRVCVVGDDAQSIYSFRGANIGNILNFRKVYPEAKLFKLEQNYRSTQTIVNAANSLIYKNVDQIHKKVFSEKEKGDKIQVIGAYSDYEEGYAVAARVAEMRMLKQYNYRDFAILYRTNAQSRIFEEALRKRSIPYKIFGGLSFYQRKEIKDIITYFRMAVNPHDEEALKRTINYPSRGIGDTTVGKIGAAAITHNVSLWQILSDPLKYNLPVNAGTAGKLAGYKNLILSFAAKNLQENAYETGRYIMQETGIVGELYADKTPEGLSRIQNMEELLNSLKEFVENRQEEGIEGIKLTDFLAEISLMTDQDTDTDEIPDWVTLMTVHSSKGLEFKNVFVVGMEEDLFPSSMAREEAKGIEEERRLFYVAITRAEESCILSYAKSRFIHGKTDTRRPSRFLKDVDAEYLKIPLSMEQEITTAEPMQGKLDRNFFERKTGNSSSTGCESPAHTSGKNRVQREKETYTPPWEKEKTTAPPAKLSKVEIPAAASVAQIGELSVGNTIMHERFGMGKVTALEGDKENAKATVEFESFGKKQLLLKFAKFIIVKN